MSNHRSASTPQNACTPEKVKELADAGHGRNAIAGQLGVTTYRVDKAARAAGVTFDRAATRKAVEARQVDAHAEREELATQFRAVARVVLQRILGSDEMPTPELRDLIWSAGAAASSDVRIGRLALEAETLREGRSQQDGVFSAVDAFATAFKILDSVPVEVLEERVAAETAAWEEGANLD